MTAAVGRGGRGGEGEGIGGGGSGDVLAKVTAGNAVYVRRSKVACRVAEFSPLALAPFAFLPSRMPPPLPTLLPRPSIRSFVRPSVAISLLLPLARGPAARRRLQECTKCTALTDTRPRSTASTCLLRPFASPCSSSRSLSLSLLHGPSFLFSPVGYSASAGHSRILYIVLPPPPPLPGTDRFSTTGVVARLFSSTPSWYVRPSTHAMRVDRYAEERTLCRRCRGYIPGRPSRRRVLTTCVLAPSRRAFSFSLPSSG